ncbi:hypothetical protein Tdes44962_MAKER08556 [Teratosphaeria destructans]|uniref:Uncharacterized protein n=1 Tax=Teratosphaeria destructans TaxID=418781 RepID=A0A9W7SW65_9PEZI|nr:hypothetical protein Tdes44962_MAKER08556 [Teratosphaeria destructans]
MSPCLSVSLLLPSSRSHNLTVKSPELEASTFSAAGLNSTCPTFLLCPLSLPTGFTSSGSSASVWREKFSGTCHRNTLASSEPEAMMLSLNGCQSVSSTAAVCPRNNGISSGSLPFSSRGMTANAPPPLASQLTARYLGFALTKLVSQAFLLMRRLS